MQGKAAFITGGANGIGRAAAREFALRGARVAIADIDEAACRDTVAALRREHKEVIGFAIDVSNGGQVEAALEETVRAFGRLDILYANAGIELQKYAIDTGEHEWDRVMNVNLKGVFLCCKHALRHMIPRASGVILMTSSPHALATYEEIAAYAASKGGVSALCRALALESAKYGIRVNCILPGTIDTPMVRREIAASSQPEQLQDMIAHMHPLGRIGLPEDIAKGAAFLASDDASFITGASLAIDGGLLAKLG